MKGFNHPLKNVQQDAFRALALEYCPVGAVLRTGGTTVTRVDYDGLSAHDLTHCLLLQQIKKVEWILVVGYQWTNERIVEEYRRCYEAGMAIVAIQLHNENWLTKFNTPQLDLNKPAHLNKIAEDKRAAWIAVRSERTRDMSPVKYMRRSKEVILALEEAGFKGLYLVNCGMPTDQEGPTPSRKLFDYTEGVMKEMKSLPVQLDRLRLSGHSYPPSSVFTLERFQALRERYGFHTMPLFVTEASANWKAFKQKLKVDAEEAYELVDVSMQSLAGELLAIDIVFHHCLFEQHGVGAINLNGPTPIYDAQVQPSDLIPDNPDEPEEEEEVEGEEQTKPSHCKARLKKVRKTGRGRRRRTTFICEVIKDGEPKDIALNKRLKNPNVLCDKNK